MREIVFVVRQVTIFLLLSTLLINLFSGTEYKKYIQYAVGLIVMVMVVIPVLKVIREGVKIDFFEIPSGIEEQVRQQENKMKELEKQYENELLREKGEYDGGGRE